MKLATTDQKYKINIYLFSKYIGKGRQVKVYKKEDKVYKVYHPKFYGVRTKPENDLAQEKMVEGNISLDYYKTPEAFLYNKRGNKKGFVAGYVEQTEPLENYLKLEMQAVFQNIMGLVDGAFLLASMHIYIADTYAKNTVFHTDGAHAGIYMIDPGVFAYVKDDTTQKIYLQNIKNVIHLIESSILYGMKKQEYQASEIAKVEFYFDRLKNWPLLLLKTLRKDTENCHTLEEFIKNKLLGKDLQKRKTII